MADRDELEELRRLDELERRAGASEASTGMVALQAVPKAVANIVNTPVALWNLAKAGASALHPEIAEYATPTPNYPMEAMKAVGLVTPAGEPQTPTQRLVDTAVQAGTSLLLAPAKAAMDVVRNVSVGLTSGTLAQVTKEATGSDLLKLAVGVTTPYALYKVSAPAASILTPTGKATLEEAQQVGYVVQPSVVTKSGFGMRRLESLGGKAAVQQDMALRNQTVTNQLAAKSIGLPENTPLSMSALESVRKQAGKVYEEIDQLRASPNMPWFPRFHDKNLLDQLNKARADTTAFFQEYARTGRVAARRMAERHESLANSIEADIEQIAKAAGKPELIDKLHAARMLIARTHNVEKALNIADGNVSATIIGRLFDQGKPLTGELRTIGRFAQAFPKFARDASAVPPPGISALEPVASGAFGLGGYAAAGGPGAAAGAALPLLREPARRLLSSGAVQSRLLREPIPAFVPAARSGLVGATLLDFKDVTEE